ncbi:protection of telomeres protein 1 isoform X4 [Kryptolebias marmoratus]|uniref:protection of telomeres protein 1 isoform X4 n=1 Tax=Kryptolebias marmoratus TaxID=37003 RepID=UPI0018ACEB45|nr:protection of telomeres protein 1 isoform X4 [Kryptolebias marmoratus]
MPVYILTDGTGTRAQIPAHLTMISISLINTSTDCTNKVVKGKVIHKGPLAKLSLDNVVLKTIIQEDDASVSGSSHNLSINVFLFGSLAKNFNDAVSQGDVVMASGFIASKSPTAKKDNLHPYNLILSRDDACIYVSKVTKTPKYTYTRLDNLKNESVVNVYGVVVFFKQPFQTRGTDLCSTLKITDQSNENIGCTIFCEKLKDHPRIFQIGDIVRLHRVKVWDGTRCPYTLVEVIAEPGITEGPTSFSKVKESFIANVFVYDNHMEFAKLLKPGDFLRIYNLLATPGSNKVPGLTRSQPVEENHLAFHLHGGTSFGRGIRVLPENSLDVQELKRVFESFPEDPKDELNEVWGTPPESLVCLFLYLLSDGGTVEGSGVFTERSCSHQMMPVTLSQLKQNHPDGAYHVRVQLRSYEPRRLYQSLKLFCSKCSSIQDIPDDESVAGIFSEASQHFETCWSPKWLESRQANLPRSQGFPSQALDVLPCVQLLFQKENKDFIFLNGSTLEETCQFAARVQNIVPVTSSGGHLNLLDLSAPFLFRGRKRYYGCKQCSDAVLRKPSFGREEVIDEKLLAKAFGVQLMQFVLLMKLELQDTTDTLDVFLMKHTELFFSVSAEEASISETAQNRISQIMNILCPPEGSVGQHPWLDLCLTAYRPEGDEGQNQTCYQICNTTIFTQSDPT